MQIADAVIVAVAGFTGALLTWHLCTAPKLYGEDFVAFRASSCGRGEKRQGVLSRLWSVLIGPVIRFAARQWGKS